MNHITQKDSKMASIIDASVNFAKDKKLLSNSESQALLKEVRSKIQTISSQLRRGHSVKISLPPAPLSSHTITNGSKTTKILFTPISEGKLLISRLKDTLGVGGTAKVKEVDFYIDGYIYNASLKMSHRKFDSVSDPMLKNQIMTDPIVKARMHRICAESVYREYEVLASIHEELEKLGLPATGIQPLHYHSVSTINKDGSVSEGFLGVRLSTSGHELMGDDLTAEQMQDLCLQCATGLARLHLIGFQHGDIKPGNIFFGISDEADFLACLADFGGAEEIDYKANNFTFGDNTIKYLCPKDVKRITELEERHQLLPAESPEAKTLVLEAKGILEKSDVYSLAVTLFEILTEIPPDPESTKFPDSFPKSMPQELIDLMNRCLDENAENRPSSQELMDGFTNWKLSSPPVIYPFADESSSETVEGKFDTTIYPFAAKENPDAIEGQDNRGAP